MFDVKNTISKKTAYIAALGIVIFLISINQVLIQKILHDQKLDYTVINLAGRQRMLSQKIVKEVYQVIDGSYSIDLLKNEVIWWDKVHDSLIEGNDSLGIPKLDSEVIASIFSSIEPTQNQIHNHILKTENADQLSALLPDLLDLELIYLAKMDEIVHAFETESKAGLQRLVYLELFLSLFSLLVLIAMFRYIFKPVFESLEAENNELEKIVSEVSRSKEQLSKSIQRFNLSIKSIDAGIWDWNISDGNEWWSDNFYELLGYKPQEIPSTFDTFIEELVHPEDRSKVQFAVKQHIEKNRKYRVQIRMKLKSGYYRWFESLGQASWDEEGNAIRMVGSILDIEEKKQFEAQILNDEQTLRMQKLEIEKVLKSTSEIQEVAHIGTWQVDLKTMTAEWSDEVYRIHEVPLGEKIKVEDGINFYREDYRDVINDAINVAIKEKKPWDVECILVTRSGKEIWVRAIGFPVFGNIELIALRGLFMDIDKRKRSQIELDIQNNKSVELSTKLSLAVNTGKVGVWVWDIKSNGLEWNDEMLEIYEITREDFTNGYDSYSESVHPEDLPRIEKELEKAVSTKSRFDTDFRIKTSKGEVKHIIAKADIILNDEGMPEKMIGVNYDITGIKYQPD